MKIFVGLICILLLSACSFSRATHPGSSSGMHNETLLGNATDDALKKALIPYKKISRPLFVEIISNDKGRIYTRVVPVLRDNGIKIVQRLDDASVLLKISEKTSGVSEVAKMDWWFWPIPPIGYWNGSITSQAKSVLLIELIDVKSNNVIYSRESASETLYSDINKMRMMWLIFFPVPLENYSVNGQGE